MAFVGVSPVPNAGCAARGLGRRVVWRVEPVVARRTMTVMAMRTLYVKAAQDGKTLGDCPFCHKSILMLNAKGLDFEMNYIDLANKPDWYLQINEKGTVPTLDDDSTIITDSGELLTFVEDKYPDPSLLVKDEELLAKYSPVFPAFAKFLRNKEADQEEELKQNLETALTNLDEHLNANGPYLAGDKMTTADFDLAPKLYHAKYALPYYKKFDIAENYPAVAKYMDTVFSSDLFLKDVYTPETIIWGWSKFFQ